MKFPLMRCHDGRSIPAGAQGLGQARGLGHKACDGVSVQNDRALPDKAAKTASQVAAPTPSPGPRATAFRRLSAKNWASSSAPSTGRTMTARLAAALTVSASRGLAMVTRPAPARSAARAAKRAAPSTTPDLKQRPRAPGRICVHQSRERGNGRATAQARSRTSSRRSPVARSLECQYPPPAAAMKPARQKDMSHLLAKKSDALRGVDRHPHHRSSRAVNSARQVHGQYRRRLSVHGLDHGPRLSFHRPIKPGAEQSVHNNTCVRKAVPMRLRDWAFPFRRSARRIAFQARNLSREHQAHVEPALRQQPGRNKTIAAVVARSRQYHDLGSDRMARGYGVGDRAPARSISVMPAVPPAIVSRSAFAISALLRSSIMTGQR